MPKTTHGKNTSHPDFPHGKFSGWRADCRCEECVIAHRTYKREYNKNLRATNSLYVENQKKDKERFRKTEAGKAYLNSMCQKRNALKKQRSCSENLKLLQLIYLNCPKNYQVDHIIPLSKGGNHVPDNLQYLPAKINMQKNNKLDFDCAEHIIKWQLVIENLQRSERKLVGSSEPKWKPSLLKEDDMI